MVRSIMQEAKGQHGHPQGGERHVEQEQTQIEQQFAEVDRVAHQAKNTAIDDARRLALLSEHSVSAARQDAQHQHHPRGTCTQRLTW